MKTLKFFSFLLIVFISVCSVAQSNYSTTKNALAASIHIPLHLIKKKILFISFYSRGYLPIFMINNYYNFPEDYRVQWTALHYL